MPNEEKNNSELDDLAANFFKQIGIEDFSGTIEFAKDVEKDVKKREKTLPKIPKTDDATELKKLLEEKELKILELEKFIEDKQNRVDELENKVLPAFILMIKDYLEQVSNLKDDIKIRDEKINHLKTNLINFKSKIQGLKSKWF